MIDPITLRAWILRALFVGLALMVFFFQFLPINLLPSGWPGPDLVALLAFAWVLRRPEFLPLPSVVAVFLASDLLFIRPPGLWTALMVMGVEFLRARRQISHEQPFLTEWAVVAVVYLVQVTAYYSIRALTFVDLPDMAPVAIGTVGTLILYPLVVVLCRYGLGVRQMTPSEADAAGRRL